MQIVSTVKNAKGKVSYILFGNSEEDRTEYGITVRSELFGGEESTVTGITADREFAEKILHLLADNLVLPSTLKEVVEELVTAAYTVT